LNVHIARQQRYFNSKTEAETLARVRGRVGGAKLPESYMICRWGMHLACHRSAPD